MLPVLRATRAPLPALAVLCVLLLPCAAWARHKPEPAPPPQPHASLPPFCTIPADPLGFAPPGDIYLGSHNTLVSLDFLDEDRLLFTFRVPGLLRRDPSGSADETERYIRALVLHIPDGHVQAEALWTLHDRARYLYPLDNGQFLLRDRNTLSLGDGSLQPTPWLRFPGPLLWVEMDPTRKFLVTGSREPAPKPAADKPATADAPAPATAQASTQASTSTANLGVKQEDYVLRILQRSSAQVLLLTHVHNAVHLPLSTEGYLDSLRSTHDDEWTVNLDYLTGGSTRVGAVDSACVPTLDFLSPQEYLARVCDQSGARLIEAFTLDGKRLWLAKGRDTNVWPVLTTNQNGTRLAMEVLHANHAINANATTFTTEDITSQEVDVFDAANGHIALRAQASPIFDAGGNVALSPSGRRAAILMQEGIEVFNLPDPPAIPAKQP